MPSRCLLALAYIIPFADLMAESICQGGLLASIPSKMEQYPMLKQLIHEEETVSHMKSSIVHTIEHLVIHQIIVLVCLFCMIVAVDSRVRSIFITLLEKTSPYFPSFMGVSSPEIVLLHLQCSIIRILESKWVWNSFVADGSIFDRMWIPFVLAILAPAEIRFKIYLEKKLHHLAPVALAILHASSAVLFPIAYFCYLQRFAGLRPLGPADPALDTMLSSARFFHVPGKSSHVAITPVNMFGHHYFVLNGDISHHYAEVCSHILFDSYQFSNNLYSMLAPFAKNMAFACFVILSDKRFLKSICSREISHICAHLILEEFLDVGFCRYLLVPFNSFEKKLAADHDRSIACLPNKAQIVHNTFSWQLHSHGNMHPSPFFEFLNSDSNVLQRLENILDN